MVFLNQAQPVMVVQAQAPNSVHSGSSSFESGVWQREAGSILVPSVFFQELDNDRAKLGGLFQIH